MPESEESSSGIKGWLAQQLYKDAKVIIPSIIRKLTIPTKKVIAKRFGSPEELLDALKSNKIKHDSFVAVECKPSTFGPFLRHHFLSPLSGISSNMKLGPTIDHEIPEFAFLAQLTSYLKPVGLYPPIDDNLTQVTLYPSDATCCGYIGMVPGISNLITSLPAIVNQDKISFCGAPSVVIGVVRVVTQTMFQDRGIPIEVYEELRQSGDIWYLDVYSEGTEIKPLFDGVVTEMWAGIYASGHIEMEGNIQVDPLINGVADAFRNAGYAPVFNQNFAKGKEISILSEGLRFTLFPSGAIYTLHMDAEIGINYKKSRSSFDNICDNMLEVILEAAKKSDAKVNNPKDLDFTYTDSAKSFSTLESKSAEEISDPTAIIVRDWHRKKNKK